MAPTEYQFRSFPNIVFDKSRYAALILHISGCLFSLILVSWVNIDILPFNSLNYFLLSISACFIIYGSTFFALGSRLDQLVLVVFIWAVVFRCIGLFSGPLLEDDPYRYLWDAFVFANHGTPFGILPSEYFSSTLLPMQIENILDHVAYPDTPTIYGPFSQWVFYLAYLIQPGSLLVLKLLFLVFDITCLMILFHLLSGKWFLLFAWNPLLVKEFSFSVHHDIIAISMVVVALYAYRHKYYLIVALCLGLAVAGKLLAVVLVPFMLRLKSIRCLLVFTATLILMYLPFMVKGGGTELSGLFAFMQGWEFNSSVYALLSALLGKSIASKISLTMLCLGLLGIFLATVKFRTQHVENTNIPRGDWVIGGVLLFSSVVNPWYVCWILPFAAFYRQTWPWAAATVMPLSYVIGLNIEGSHLPAYNHPDWVRPTIYITILLALCFDIFLNKKRRIEGEK